MLAPNNIDASNVILNLIIAEYICLTFANVTSQMKILSWLSISILMMWSASIWRRCESHCSFMFSCTSRTYMFDFNFIIEFSMRRLIVMSNFFDLQVKCVNSYFSEANIASWVQAHFAQTSCAWLSNLQLILWFCHRSEYWCHLRSQALQFWFLVLCIFQLSLH